MGLIRTDSDKNSIDASRRWDKVDRSNLSHPDNYISITLEFVELSVQEGFAFFHQI